MSKETMKHLTDNGIMAVQFGELNFTQAASRTSRYVVTARKALEELGVRDANNHLLVAAELTNHGDLSTIIVKRTSITPAEAGGFVAGVKNLAGAHVVAAPGRP